MIFLTLSGRESNLVQTFCESCEQLDITHPSVPMTHRFVIQGCPNLKKGVENVVSHIVVSFEILEIPVLILPLSTSPNVIGYDITCYLGNI